MSSRRVPPGAANPGRAPRGGRPRKYPLTPKSPKVPKNAHGSCMVGELLVPLFGRSWVDEVTAHGGLVPYLLHRALSRLFPARSPEAYR